MPERSCLDARTHRAATSKREGPDTVGALALSSSRDGRHFITSNPLAEAPKGEPVVVLNRADEVKRSMAAARIT